MARLTFPMMVQAAAIRNRSFRIAVLAIGGPIAYAGLFLAPSVLVFPTLAAIGFMSGTPWAIPVVAANALLMVGVLVLALRSFLARRSILGETSFDAIVFMCGLAAWTACIPLFVAYPP